MCQKQFEKFHVRNLLQKGALQTDKLIDLFNNWEG